MNKFTLMVLITASLFSAHLLAAESKDKAKPSESAGSSLFEEFSALSSQSLSASPKPVAATSIPTGIFIEQEANQHLASPLVPTLTEQQQGQWSVSFDLNQLDFADTQFNLDKGPGHKDRHLYDWQLGTSLVAADKTTRFYLNYGNRKVPISISFDDDFDNPSTLSQEQLKLGFEQEFNESWAVSISYLKTDNQLEAPNPGLVADKAHQFNYLLDFNQSNQLETLNFSPFQANGLMPSFIDDVSAIQIKVSRQLTDELSLSAKAASQSGYLTAYDELAQINSSLGEYSAEQFKSQQIELEGQYQVTDSWSVDASLEHEQARLFDHQLGTQDPMNRFDTTILDIGVQYQSQWEQVGVVIRIDLVNLLGLEGLHDSQNRSSGLDQNGLQPFSFNSPKYIKLSGSINF